MAGIRVSWIWPSSLRAVHSYWMAYPEMPETRWRVGIASPRDRAFVPRLLARPAGETEDGEVEQAVRAQRLLGLEQQRAGGPAGQLQHWRGVHAQGQHHRHREREGEGGGGSHPSPVVLGERLAHVHG